MATKSKHRVNCMCPGCRSARGEKWATKKRFTTSIKISILDNMQEWALQHNTSLAAAIEKALDDFLNKSRAEQILRGGPIKEKLREYTNEEIQEFIDADKIDPALAEKVDKLLND